MAAPIRMTGLGSDMIPPNMVEKLMEVQKIPVENAKKRRETVVKEKDEVGKLSGMVNDLDGALNALKTQASFYRMKVESSHPDIIDGTVQEAAMPGTYEFEVRGMAKAEKELAFGFPDKNETAVGFGYMLVEREDKEPMEVVVEPGSTLEKVAQQINDADAGVRAMVINTKYTPDSYRLLVVSEKSGKEARIVLDEDTTYLEFKEQVTGRNLDVLFEDVPITDDDNVLDELIDGVTFQAKRSEPGTRVQVNVTFDVDATLTGIKTFVEKYNALADFIHGQFQVDPNTKKAGILSGDGSIKTILRQLQGSFGLPENNNSKYRTLADIGITTNPKTGSLVMDDAKVKGALAEDYEAVAKLFIRSRDSVGIAEKLAAKIKSIKDPVAGTLKTKTRGLDQVIKNSDEDIERRERMLEQKEDSLRKRFSSLEGQLSGLKSQGDFLSQRMNQGGGGGGGG